MCRSSGSTGIGFAESSLPPQSSWSCTYAASVLVFLPFRAHQVGVDALFAFFFMSNWWFAAQRTDYFAAGDAVSPIQHYWSLSIEEQFYFVWPALIFLIGLLVVRKAWTHRRRMRLAAAVMACVVAVSLGWALYETAAWPTWAYFNTFARVWELGVGALLATVVGVLARIPVAVKPWLSWAGLGLIAASLLLITEDSGRFPGAVGTAAGDRRRPRHRRRRGRRTSTRVSAQPGQRLRREHLVLAVSGALACHRHPRRRSCPAAANFYLAAVAITFGLAIGSYHFVENPLRYSDWRKARSTIHEIRRRRFHPQQSSRYATARGPGVVDRGAHRLCHAAPGHLTEVPSPVAASPPGAPPEPTEAKLGPLASALQQQITTALSATQWPHLDPSMESGISETWPADINRCAHCTPERPRLHMGFTCRADPDHAGRRFRRHALREIAARAGVELRRSNPGARRGDGGMPLHHRQVFTPDQSLLDACPARKQHAVDYINANKPTVVIISNQYVGYYRLDGEQCDDAGRVV